MGMKLGFYAVRALLDAIGRFLPEGWEPTGEEPQITAVKDGPDEGRVAVVVGVRRRGEIDRTHLERRKRG